MHGEHEPTAQDGRRLAAAEEITRVEGHDWPAIQRPADGLGLAPALGGQPGVAALEDYLQRVGRRTLVVPLYAALMNSPSGALFAKRVFAKARDGYNPETAEAIAAMVDPKSESSE